MSSSSSSGHRRQQLSTPNLVSAAVSAVSTVSATVTTLGTALLPRGLSVETIIHIVVQVEVLSLVLLVIIEVSLGGLVHDLRKSRRLLLSRVLVGVEVSDLDTELVTVGIGNLNVVLIGKQVAVIRLESTESESLSSLSQVGVLVRVLGLGTSKILRSDSVLVRVLVIGVGVGVGVFGVLLLLVVRVVELGRAEVAEVVARSVREDVVGVVVVAVGVLDVVGVVFGGGVGAARARAGHLVREVASGAGEES